MFKELWLRLFHTTTFLGIDMGFWVSMAICLLIVIVMEIVFYSFKPYDKKSKK